MASKLEKVLSDEGLRRQLGQKGRQKAKEYGWEKAAHATLRAFEEAVKG
jgi:glycosyltransferase involved in cell wall biosynthesis